MATQTLKRQSKVDVDLSRNAYSRGVVSTDTSKSYFKFGATGMHTNADISEESIRSIPKDHKEYLKSFIKVLPDTDHTTTI